MTVADTLVQVSATNRSWSGSRTEATRGLARVSCALTFRVRSGEDPLARWGSACQCCPPATACLPMHRYHIALQHFMLQRKRTTPWPASALRSPPCTRCVVSSKRDLQPREGRPLRPRMPRRCARSQRSGATPATCACSRTCLPGLTLNPPSSSPFTAARRARVLTLTGQAGAMSPTATASSSSSPNSNPRTIRRTASRGSCPRIPREEPEKLCLSGR